VASERQRNVNVFSKTEENNVHVRAKNVMFFPFLASRFCLKRPVRPAEENYNVKLSASLESQLRGRGSPFLTCAEWPFATINCIFYPFTLLSHFS
jgi:hypothetical protein